MVDIPEGGGFVSDPETFLRDLAKAGTHYIMFIDRDPDWFWIFGQLAAKFYKDCELDEFGELDFCHPGTPDIDAARPHVLYMIRSKLPVEELAKRTGVSVAVLESKSAIRLRELSDWQSLPRPTSTQWGTA